MPGRMLCLLFIKENIFNLYVQLESTKTTINFKMTNYLQIIENPFEIKKKRKEINLKRKIAQAH